MTKVVPAIMGLHLYNRLSGPLKWFIFYLWVSLYFDIVLYVVSITQGNNLSIMRAYLFVEIILLSAFFQEIIKSKFIWFLALSLLISIAKYTLTYDHPFLSIPTMSAVIYYIGLIGVSIYKLYGQSTITDLTSVPLYNILCSMLFYFGTSLITFSSSDLLTLDGMALTLIWMIHVGISLTSNVLFTIILYRAWNHKLNLLY